MCSRGPTVADTVDRLLAELRDRDRWLLILDNAERPADIAAYQPGGAGARADHLPLPPLGRPERPAGGDVLPAPRRSRSYEPASRP